MNPANPDLTAALNPRASAVVEACAGAGKTWLLVSRIVRLLLTGVSPGQVLAITFTRKAGEEMRTRLSDWLTAMAAMDDTALSRFLLERGVGSADAPRLLLRARSLALDVAAASPGMTVTTFDSWFYTLTQQAPIDAPLARGEIVAADTRLYQAAWAEVFATAERNTTPALTAALDALLARLGWQRLRGLIADASQHTLAWQEWVRTHAPAANDEVAIARANAMLGHAMGASTAPNHATLLGLMKRLGGCFLHKDHTALAQAHREAAAAFATGDVTAIADFLFTAERTVKQQIYRACTKYGQLQTLQQLVRGVEESIAAAESAGAISLHADLYRVWHAWQQALAAVKRRDAVITFSDLTQNAVALTRDATLAEALAYKLDSRYKHILIDELQDVSPAQWRIVTDWLNHASPAETTVFAVGDPKQCIYGFRGSNTALFAKACDDLQRMMGARIYHADTTRRLAVPIAHVVNQVFASHLPLPVFRPHSVTSQKPGGVWVLPLASVAANARHDRPAASLAAKGPRNPLTTPSRVDRTRAATREAESVADAIAALVGALDIEDGAVTRPARLSDVLVLVRAKSVMPDLEDAFRRAGLPYAALRQGGLVSRIEMRDFAALVRFLATPEDNLSLAHVLRAPLFGLDDDALITLAREAKSAATPDAPAPTWWHTLGCTATLPAFSEAHATLVRWLAMADCVPPHDLLSRIVVERDAYTRYRRAAPPHLADQAVSNINALLELSLDLNGGRAPSLLALADELAALATVPEQESPSEGESLASDDHIRLMTIHAAKGLEAPIVVLADAHRPPPRRPRDHVIVEWPLRDAAPQHFSWAMGGTQLGKQRQQWVNVLNAREAVEETNLLYVAMTRAVQYLLVTGHDRVGASKDGRISWYTAIAAVSPPTDAPPIAFASRIQVPPQTGETIQTPLAIAALPRQRKVGARRASLTPPQAFGISFHAWMERLAPLPPADRAAALAYEVDSDVRNAVAKTLASEAAAHFFDPRFVVEARNESELLGSDGTVLRPDRLVRTHDAWWVLDYKTGVVGPTVAPEIRSQLSLYVAALKQHAGSLPVHAAVITRDGDVLVVDT